jgi:hypothetical protein
MSCCMTLYTATPCPSPRTTCSSPVQVRRLFLLYTSSHMRVMQGRGTQVVVMCCLLSSSCSKPKSKAPVLMRCRSWLSSG